MSWVLVMYIYAGSLAKGDSVSTLAVDGFTTQSTCSAAGEQARPLVSFSTKEYRFVCIQKK